MTDSEESGGIATGTTGGQSATNFAAETPPLPVASGEPPVPVSEQIIEQAAEKPEKPVQHEVVMTGQVPVASMDETPEAFLTPEQLARRRAKEQAEAEQEPEEPEEPDEPVAFGAGWGDLLDAPVPEPPNENTGSGEGGASTHPQEPPQGSA